MLKLTHHFQLPRFARANQPMLSPVEADGDELIQSLEAEHDADTIRLENTPDVRQLDTFWTGVQADLQGDPEWFQFSDD